mgnify:CR=1 FL=1
MDVKFDVVRIGERRKNHLSEILLEENTIMLKNTLVDFLFDLVKIKFSGFIYKGSDDSFLININNRVFR